KQAPLDHLAVWALFGTLPKAEYTVLFDFHAAHKPFSAKFAQKAYQEIPGWEEKITRHLVEVFPALQGAKASIRPVGQENWTGFIEWPGKTPISIEYFGDGARHVLKVLAVLTAMAERVDENHPGLFLWEDPELFMHPASLQRLLQQVMQLVEEKPIQVFLSSQSLETVALLTHYFHKKAINGSEELRAFRLNLEGGNLYAATFHFENLVTWLDQGMDPRFLGVVDLPFSYRYNIAEASTLEEDI
ncbi:MAG: ATP-binding protein, partial [Bacteroidetes bacterium]